jgi:hypothetical protein
MLTTCVETVDTPWVYFGTSPVEAGSDQSQLAQRCLAVLAQAEQVCPAAHAGLRDGGRLDALQPEATRSRDRTVVLERLAKGESPDHAPLAAAERVALLSKVALPDPTLPRAPTDEVLVREIVDGLLPEAVAVRPCDQVAWTVALKAVAVTWALQDRVVPVRAAAQVACAAALEGLIAARRAADFFAEAERLSPTDLPAGQLAALVARMNAAPSRGLGDEIRRRASTHPATAALLARAALLRGEALPPLPDAVRAWMTTQARFGVSRIDACRMTFAQAPLGVRAVESSELGGSVCFDLTLEHYTGAGETTSYLDEGGNPCTDYRSCASRVTRSVPERRWETTSSYVGRGLLFPLGPDTALTLPMPELDLASRVEGPPETLSAFLQNLIRNAVARQLPLARSAWLAEQQRAFAALRADGRHADADEVAAKVALTTRYPEDPDLLHTMLTWFALRYDTVVLTSDSLDATLVQTPP